MVPNLSPLATLAHQKGIAPQSAITDIQAHSAQYGRPFVESFAGADVIAEQDLARLLSEHLGLPKVSLDGCQPDPQAIRLLTAEQCRKHLVFPIELISADGFDFVVLAMADPLDTRAIRFVYEAARLRVRPLVAEASDVCSAVARVYRCAFEPLMGPTIASGPMSPDDTRVVPQTQNSAHFDAVENILGPFISGLDDALMDRFSAQKAFQKCLETTESSRDVLLIRLLLQLSESGLIDPVRLLQARSISDNNP